MPDEEHRVKGLSFTRLRGTSSKAILSQLLGDFIFSCFVVDFIPPSGNKWNPLRHNPLIQTVGKALELFQKCGPLGGQEGTICVPGITRKGWKTFEGEVCSRHGNAYVGVLLLLPACVRRVAIRRSAAILAGQPLQQHDSRGGPTVLSACVAHVASSWRAEMSALLAPRPSPQFAAARVCTLPLASISRQLNNQIQTTGE